ELAVYRDRLDRTRAGFVSAHAGKLSDHSAGLAGRALFFGWLDHGDEIVSVICRALQPLRRNLSGVGIDHYFADVDVSHVFVPVGRRQIERDPSPGTRKASEI